MPPVRTPQLGAVAQATPRPAGPDLVQLLRPQAPFANLGVLGVAALPASPPPLHLPRHRVQARRLPLPESARLAGLVPRAARPPGSPRAAASAVSAAPGATRHDSRRA